MHEVVVFAGKCGWLWIRVSALLHFFGWSSTLSATFQHVRCRWDQLRDELCPAVGVVFGDHPGMVHRPTV